MRARFVGAAGLAAGLLLASGVAAATTDSEVINACTNDTTGAVRVTTDACRNGESALSWNQRGVPGPQGPAGEQGPEGPAGLAGVDGQSVISAVEPAGTNCAAGGSRFTAANGVTYACHGTTADGSDAETLAGHGIEDFRLHCRTGFVLHGGLCWEDVDQSGLTLGAAAARCGALGGRLPLLTEFMSLAANGVQLRTTTLLDWTANTAGDGVSIFINSSTPADMDGERANSVLGYGRCVVPPHNALG